eukprot:CAMPEP_0170300330 /NCGR_PEP_ID=MMETSP0116_2-20130129/50395_1 /TAXON_ID=400756 /ORGANISM="Durinskia baltica, Strain CSIRO CS-38" /LENGTH=118 /DNA_ID=CAMNT_0010552093 /DNA_START=29 /DNA_END=382 /DNA_ORIENTATION=+
MKFSGNRGDVKDQRFKLSLSRGGKKEIKIGRGDDNDINVGVDRTAISRTHCILKLLRVKPTQELSAKSKELFTLGIVDKSMTGVTLQKRNSEDVIRLQKEHKRSISRGDKVGIPAEVR